MRDFKLHKSRLNKRAGSSKNDKTPPGMCHRARVSENALSVALIHLHATTSLQDTTPLLQRRSSLYDNIRRSGWASRWALFEAAESSSLRFIWPLATTRWHPWCSSRILPLQKESLQCQCRGNKRSHLEHTELLCPCSEFLNISDTLFPGRRFSLSSVALFKRVSSLQ